MYFNTYLCIKFSRLFFNSNDRMSFCYSIIYEIPKREKKKRKGRIKVLFPDEMLLKGLQSLIELS